MLFRVGRIVYFCIFALLVLVWTGAHDNDARQMLHKGWDVTAHAFSQKSPFTVDNIVVSDGEKVRPDESKSEDIVQEQRTKSIEV